MGSPIAVNLLGMKEVQEAGAIYAVDEKTRVTC